MRHVQIDITVSGINKLYFTQYENLRDVFQVFPSPGIFLPSGFSGKQGQSTNQTQTCQKPVFLYIRDRLKRAVWGRLMGSAVNKSDFCFHIPFGNTLRQKETGQVKEPELKSCP